MHAYPPVVRGGPSEHLLSTNMSRPPASSTAAAAPSTTMAIASPGRVMQLQKLNVQSSRQRSSNQSVHVDGMSVGSCTHMHVPGGPLPHAGRLRALPPFARQPLVKSSRPAPPSVPASLGCYTPDSAANSAQAAPVLTGAQGAARLLCFARLAGHPSRWMPCKTSGESARAM